MPTPTFQRLDLAQFEALLQSFPFTRKINAVHMHHTWRPRRVDFRGHDTIVSMWRHHTQVNGWSDIAQHITIDPQGAIWLGRNWNRPPASASGHNGSSVAGPFMFEMVGDFDTGQEPFDGAQKDTALRVVALVHRRFGLRPATLRFHNMMSTKTCPGSSISYDATVQEVEQLHAELGAAAAPRGARGAPALEAFPDEQGQVMRQAIQALTRLSEPAAERGDAEDDHECLDCHDAHEPAAERQMPGARGDVGVGPATLAGLRPHLVNLRSGMFSTEGEWKSTPADVDSIFEQHLPEALGKLSDGEKLRVVFYAHGGLVSEANGLRGAHRHIGWWKENKVYPIYFVWETSFFETIGDLLRRAFGGARAVTRDLADATSDPLIETAARALQGPRIWGGMKWSAERASQPGGGAHYVAQKLAEFVARHGDRIELHAIGHSAGAIFHSHFLPACHSAGVPAFQTLQLLAPAIRADAFKRLLLPGLVDDSLAEKVSVFTMSRDFERDDNCARIYRKSLLYLIHHALEDDRRTPILGLEESLRGDPELKQFFGLGGSNGHGEVIWSKTSSDTGRSASQSTTHGGFDDDAPTMNSVARRLLDAEDADPIKEFPAIARAIERSWTDEVDWPHGWSPAGPGTAQQPQFVPAPAATVSGAPPSFVPPVEASSGGGRRIALCIGIDAYPNPEHRLSGCTNDAKAWARALQAHGFEVAMLLDGQATRAEMDAQLHRVVTQSRAGDVVVVQYAGHGTNVPDLNGDEDDGRDEALCPVDFAAGALYIDDDISDVFAKLPSGVNLTVFMDCCHSASNTRFAGGPQTAAIPPGSKARYVKETQAVDEAHIRFRGNAGPARSRGGSQEEMSHVKFAACQDHEVALESSGSGDFTRRALLVLQRQGLTNEAFQHAVVAEFGPGARQKPWLDCATSARGQLLLQPLGRSAGTPAVPATRPAVAGDLAPAVVALAESVLLLSRKVAS
jgi:hypothetical protein